MLRYVEWVFLAYFIYVNSFLALLLIGAAIGTWWHLLGSKWELHWQILRSRMVPRISIIVPAYDEVKTIVDSVSGLLTLSYPDLEIVVVNDGSKDGTLSLLQDRFELTAIQVTADTDLVTEPILRLYRSANHPNLVVAHKDNSGKADSLNVGLSLSTGDLVCDVDADTLLETDALQRMVRPFLENHTTVAVGGSVNVVNASPVEGGVVEEFRIPRLFGPAPESHVETAEGESSQAVGILARLLRIPQNIIVGVQSAEYIRAFSMGRIGWNNLGGNLIISGACGLFRRQSMIAIGGYERATASEDMELIVRLRRYGQEHDGISRVAFVPGLVSWTEVPETPRDLGRQRARWHWGLAGVLWYHRGVFLNPRYRSMGFVAFPYFLIVELLAPVMELAGVIFIGVAAGIGKLDVSSVVFLALAAYGYGLLLSFVSFVFADLTFTRKLGISDRLRLLFWTVLEFFGYRQFTAVMRMWGLVEFILGRGQWGAIRRRGFGGLASQSQPSEQPAGGD